MNISYTTSESETRYRVQKYNKKYYTAGTTPLEVLTLYRYGAALNRTTVVKRPPRSHLWG
ncbi:hypothetical protein Taro_026569 [Colocasia esculenta]|uniref:Uncharacterized protein n=1 Tax=Colocasia esculenta TaxID=4460 RepID=A0A843VHI4_COLES|nr:hypothetical protein [Colocasia esculenta]